MPFGAFDMNGTLWEETTSTGKLQVADSATLAHIGQTYDDLSGGSREQAFDLHVWEDDWERCKIFTQEYTWQDQVVLAASTAEMLKWLVTDSTNTYWDALAVAVAMVWNEPDWLDLATGQYDEDDFLGAIKHQDGWNANNASSPVSFIPVVSGDQIVGSANIEYLPGAADVWIVGPSSIEESGTYNWYAYTNGTRGTISYEWWIKEGTSAWSLLSTDYAISRTVSAPPDFELRIEIVADGGMDSDSLYVPVYISEPCGDAFCPENWSGGPN